MSSIYVLKGFLSPKECESARALFPPQSESAVNTVDDLSAVTRARRSRNSFLPPDTDERRALTARLLAALKRANVAGNFHFEFDDTEQPQLATYAAGDEYSWHLDIGPGEAARRKLSASVQLSNPADYDGGDLDIWGAPDGGERDWGTLIVFPSYMLHRVSPVTRGVRHSLVAWARGKSSYR